MGAKRERESVASWEEAYARLRFFLSQVGDELTNRNWHLPPRPWSQFFERFTLPKKTISAWSDRVTLNSHIYQTNYVVILTLFLIYYCLTHPWSVLLLSFISMGWIFALSSVPIAFQGRRVTRKERILFGSVVTVLLLVFSGTLYSFSQHLSVTFAVLLAHASFRHTGMRTKINEIREQMSNRW